MRSLDDLPAGEYTIQAVLNRYEEFTRSDGRTLWLSGRYDHVVYAFDTTTGEVKIIPVGKEPHGLTVWPQPGRYSLGHTGNLR